MPIYAVDKPLLVTSHDVVSTARRLLGTRRVGHGGTLDPLASGVLALLVGEDTKLSPYLTDSGKRYLAWVSFGASTPTLDAEGPLVAEEPGLRERADELDARQVSDALAPFLTLSEQVPPQFSAVKRQGVKGYEAARRGERLELPARPAGYAGIELLAFGRERDQLPSRFSPRNGSWLPDPNGREAPLPPPLGRFPTALLFLEVKAGTYVRSFARDLGSALGTAAFLSGLLRTGAGSLDLARAVPPEALPGATPVAPASALPYPKRTLDSVQTARVRKGQRLPLRLGERTAFVDADGQMVALAEEHEGRMRLLRVWGGQ